ncbi:MAG: hypothetical protein GYA21_15260 [Myxococcales bacterium]|nr:hypothetical protein [Myxococcales bacterium]
MKIKRIFSERISRPGPAAALPILALGAGGCGPNSEEIGRAMLLASPLVMLVFFGFARLLFVLWRKVRPDFSMRLAPVSWTTGALALLAILALALPYHDPNSDEGEVLNLTGVAIYLGGSTMLSAQLLLYLFLRLLAPPRAFTWSHLGALIILWPAPFLAFVPGSGVILDPAIMVWAFGGFWGIVPGVLLSIAILDAVLARRRHARIQAALS